MFLQTTQLPPPKHNFSDLLAGGDPRSPNSLCSFSSEMNITGTLPQAGNLKLFVPSLSTQSSTRPKQTIFNVVLMRPDKTE